MKNFYLVPMMVIALMLSVTNAHALSEQAGATNTDGTSKFADPDEQSPSFLVAPGTNNGSSALDPSERSVNAPSVSDMMGATRQSDQDFNRAFSHLQNQNQ